MTDYNSTRTFDDETIANIHDVLLIGLAAFGEVERLYDAQSVREMTGASVSEEEARVFHPTGTTDVLPRFAKALRALESLRRGTSEQVPPILIGAG